MTNEPETGIKPPEKVNTQFATPKAPVEPSKSPVVNKVPMQTPSVKNDSALLQRMEKLEKTNEILLKEVKTLKEDSSAIIPEPEKKSRKEEDLEKIHKLSEDKFKEAKASGETWVTLVDEAKNYWNSGDESHFYLSQGRCKKLPEDITPVIEHALSRENLLLREATDAELRKELEIVSEEELVSLDQIKPRKYTESGIKL